MASCSSATSPPSASCSLSAIPPSVVRRRCLKCRTLLAEPYNQCMACPLADCYICLPCFAKGSETEIHSNDHPYSTVRNNFPLFEGSDWLASEEEKLLNAIWECGLGNWEDVAAMVQTRSKEECEQHYDKYYIYAPQPPLPVLPEPEVEVDIRTAPYPFRPSDDPPRPAPDSLQAAEMAGYNAARGDFAVEYDNNFELELRDIDFEQHSDEDEVEKEVKLAMLDIYRSRLRERARRKWVIREHGLIDQRRALSTQHYYGSVMGKSLVEKLLKFSQFHAGDEFDMIMERLRLAAELRKKIRLLQECRENGLTRLHYIPIYQKLKRQREEHAAQNRRTALDEVLAHIRDENTSRQWFQHRAWKENAEGLPEQVSHPVRRTAPPMDISGLPGYEKLTEDEVKLASSLRLPPETFLQIKATLIAECTKLCGLRLAQARTLIKIDVNKTRKIYDFLMAEGLIHKGAS